MSKWVGKPDYETLDSKFWNVQTAERMNPMEDLAQRELQWLFNFSHSNYDKLHTEQRTNVQGIYFFLLHFLLKDFEVILKIGMGRSQGRVDKLHVCHQIRWCHTRQNELMMTTDKCQLSLYREFHQIKNRKQNLFSLSWPTWKCSVEQE